MPPIKALNKKGKKERLKEKERKEKGERARVIFNIPRQMNESTSQNS